jgi:hypothetical protein
LLYNNNNPLLIARNVDLHQDVEEEEEAKCWDKSG